MRNLSFALVALMMIGIMAGCGPSDPIAPPVEPPPEPVAPAPEAPVPPPATPEAPAPPPAPEAAAEPPLTLTATLSAKEGQEETLKQELLKLVAPTHAEADCIRYVLHQSPEGNTFMFHEIWTDDAALEQHMQTPHLQAFLPKAPALLDGDLQLEKWTRVEAPLPTDVPADAIVLTVKVTAKADKIAEAKTAMTALLAPTLKEDGCILYDMNYANDDDATFLFYEIWETQEALDAHGQSAHIKAYFAISDELVDDVKFTKWQLVQ